MSAPCGGSPYPTITPRTTDGQRPFWSIMIPSYNCAEYLRQTLRSVRVALPADQAVQIEVVDDCSTRDDPAAVVADCGDPRVRFYRQPANVGPQANFTSCIQRARGEWVHILHGDDLVAPEFYATLEGVARARPDIVAAFCRTAYIDGTGTELDVSESEADQPGIVGDLIRRLGIRNVIMFPSIAVKRATYEEIGGFHPELFHAADWDMWKRVALAGPVWYEPAPMALYRMHEQSDTSALMRTGANIADARHAIEVARSYLPMEIRDDLTEQARRYHGLYAIEIAGQMMAQRSWSSAAAQVREGFRCSPSLTVARAVAQLAGRVLTGLVP